MINHLFFNLLVNTNKSLKTKLLFINLITLVSLINFSFQGLTISDENDITSLSLALTEQKMNFLEYGYWKKITVESPDNRIAEYTLNKEAFFYKTHDQNPKGLQAMMKKDLNVLIFYSDKEPVLGRALSSEVDSNSEPQEVADWIDSKIDKSTPDKIEMLNKFPYIIMSDLLLNCNAKDFLDLNDQMQKSLDADLQANIKAISKGNKKASENKSKKYPKSVLFQPEEFDNNYLDYVQNIVIDLFSIYYDFGFFKDIEMFKDVEAYGKLMEDKIDPENKKALIQNAIEILTSDVNNLNKNLVDFVESIRFLTLKCIKDYFTRYDNLFINKLFESYPQKSSISQLFENFLANVTPDEIINLFIYNNIENEEEIDTDFIENHISNADEIKNDNDEIMKSIQKNVINLFDKIYRENLKLITHFASNAEANTKPKNKLKLNTDIDFTLVMMYFVKKHFFRGYLEHLAPLIENHFYYLPVVQEKNLTELKDGDVEQLAKLRRYFRVLGFVEYVDTIDSPTVSYKKMTIFTSTDRRILI